MPLTTTPITSIRWFAELGLDDVPLVGGKNVSLGEMYREVAAQGVQVPNGFAITAEAYWLFLQEAHLETQIRALLSDLDTSDLVNLRQRGAAVRLAIMGASLPPVLEQAIVAAYDRLGAACREPVDVAVRSSATAEDLPDASFAGQQETFLNVRGYPALLNACKRCFASLFTDRAISYRTEKGFDHCTIALSIGVQRMVRSDLAVAGVMFSIDPETSFRDAVVNPDEYTVFKPTLKQGFRPILEKRLGTKEWKLIYDVGGTRLVKNVPVPPTERAQFALTDDEILTLARWACLIEDHYSARRGQPTPMDIEWAKDGQTGELYVVQARPETVQSHKTADTLEVYHLQGRGPVLVRGRSVGEKISHGPVRVITDAHRLHEFQRGEVLVTDKTDSDWEPIMKRAAAIVTNRGGRTCHAAIISRELGLPAVVGTEHGTEVLKQGAVVTVSCAEGDTGVVYDGAFFVDRLAQGVAMIAAAFYPKEVIVRLSDFKSNEYANLLGGRRYEPTEENPMLGFRGAARYYDPRYRDGFALECRAMQKVRDEMGLTNLKLMVPFCRTVEEGHKVLAEMARHGLQRGVQGLEVYVMCEIPSNVLLADDFAAIFDGFSIGSNDLTQLVLGVDRDSEIMAPLFDERNPAVQKMIAQVIQAARAKGRKIGLCGQAPSDYPDFAQFLVEQGIDSISLNPDAVLKTLVAIAAMEQHLARTEPSDPCTRHA